MSNKEKEMETRRLSDLSAFPLQNQFFDPMTGEDLMALAASIKSGGLKCPIEILPKNKAGFAPNTILHGHNRKAALVLNGETKTTVIVRHDLAEASKEVIEEDFLAENQNRRQLDPLAKARVAYRLLELERKRDGRQVQSGEARDRVGPA